MSNADRVKKLKTKDGIDELAVMKPSQLRDELSFVHTWGAQSVGQEDTNRILDVIVFFMTKAENDRTFKQMRCLTIVAIGLSIFQILQPLLKALCNP